jgi:hypothetical protein
MGPVLAVVSIVGRHEIVRPIDPMLDREMKHKKI